jgi:hypothetical protein
MTNNATTPPSHPPAPPANTASGLARPAVVAPAGPSPEEVNYLIQHLSQILIRLTDGLTPK